MVSRRRLGARAARVAALPDGAWQPRPRIWLKPHGHSPLRLPAAMPGWSPTAAAQLEQAGFRERSMSVLAHVVTAPIRCYELESADARRIALLGCFADGDRRLLVIARLKIPLDARRRARDWGELTLLTSDLAQDAAREGLVELAEELTTPSFSALDPDGRAPAALVVGDLTSETRTRLRRRLWAHGVRVERTLEQPYRSPESTRTQVAGFGGELVLLVQQGCRDSFGGLVAAAAAGSAETVILAQQDADLWPLELDEQLDALGIDDPSSVCSQVPGRAAPLDDEDAFRGAVQTAWADALGADERGDFPLRGYRIGAEFLSSVRQLPAPDRARLPWVCAMVVCGRAPELTGLEVHRFRTGAGGSDPQLVRTGDGARAWRASVRTHTPAAARLHWWDLGEGRVEFANAVRHDQAEFPE